MTAVRVNLTTLFDALAANDEATVTAQVAYALNEHIAPSQLAGRLAIPAALGDTVGDALTGLVAAGRIGDWIRVIPSGPEPGAERRQALQPATAFVAAALRAAPAIAAGLRHPDARVPDPLFPHDITNPNGPWVELRDAFVSGNIQQFGRVIMGFYASGTDYRELCGAIYFAILGRFAADGKATLATLKATQALDYVDWGDRVPALVQWLLPQLAQNGPEATAAEVVRAALAKPERDLDFVRTRLTFSKVEAAGDGLRRVIAQGSTDEVIDAVYQALKAGATGTMVGAQTAIVAAELLASTPLDASADLDRATMALRVANAARIATYQVQDIRVLPIVFQAANVVNQAVKALGNRAIMPPTPTAGSAMQGGLIEFVVLRNLSNQIAQRDEGGARMTLRRYAQMSFSARSICGQLGLAAARSNPAGDAGRAMLVVQEAGETFTALPLSQQAKEGGALLDAMVHVIMAQQGDDAQALRIETATGTKFGE